MAAVANVGVRLGRGRVGRTTRGKTAPNRLRRSDWWLVYDGALRRAAPLFVDLGFGADPTTTLESYERLARRVPGLRVVGVEIDRARVDAALPATIPGRVEFRLGGFDVPLFGRERAGAIRAMNVLRQCDEGEYAGAVARMGRALADGGVLFEGTSSPSGSLLTANVFRRRGGGLEHEGLLLSPNPARPWRPRDLQPVLPKNLIHRVAPGSPLDELFECWEDGLRDARRARVAERTAFARAVGHLAHCGYDVDRRPSLGRRGYLFLRTIPD